MKKTLIVALTVISIPHVTYAYKDLPAPLDQVITELQSGVEKEGLFTEVKTRGNPIFASVSLGPVGFAYIDSKYYVIRDDESFCVENHNVSKTIRNITNEQLAQFLAKGGYLSISQLDDGSFVITAKMRGFGGGAFGAWAGAILGKAAVSVVGHGTIYLISTGVGVLCPPAGIATGIALTSVLGPAIEAASLTGALAVGMTGAVLTGPV